MVKSSYSLPILHSRKEFSPFVLTPSMPLGFEITPNLCWFTCTGILEETCQFWEYWESCDDFECLFYKCLILLLTALFACFTPCVFEWCNLLTDTWPVMTCVHHWWEAFTARADRGFCSEFWILHPFQGEWMFGNTMSLQCAQNCLLLRVGI